MEFKRKKVFTEAYTDVYEVYYNKEESQHGWIIKKNCIRGWAERHHVGSLISVKRVYMKPHVELIYKNFKILLIENTR